MSDQGKLSLESPPEGSMDTCDMEEVFLNVNDEELRSPIGGYESDISTVHDFRMPGGNDKKSGLFGELPNSMHHFYTNRANLRNLYGLSDIEMSELLLENEDVNEIAEEYVSKCYNPLKKEAEEADKSNRTGDIDFDTDIDIETMIDILLASDKSGDHIYILPRRREKMNWTPQRWFLRTLVRYKIELWRLRILSPSKHISPRNAYIWAYLFLKAKEALYADPDEHEETTIALAKARENRDRACEGVKKQMELERAHFGHLPPALRSKAFADFKRTQRNSSSEDPSEGKSTGAQGLEEDQTLGLLREHAHKRKMDDPGSDQGETETDFTRNSKKMKN